MEHSFWHDRWAENRIGFHEPAPNRLLRDEIARLSLSPGDRVFLPLCGKALDIDWLSGAGFQIVGSELSTKAVAAIFERLNLTPEITPLGPLTRYCAQNIDIYAGDFFELSDEQLGPVNAIYDRAALVALPNTMRTQYATHLMSITDIAKQLLICFDYDQSRMSGPPFSVTADEVARLYADNYNIELLRREPNTGNLAKRAGGYEEAWLMVPRLTTLQFSQTSQSLGILA